MRHDFKDLIALLRLADQQDTLDDQTAIIELGLVSLELNPDPMPLYRAIRAIDYLSKLDIDGKTWQETEQDLIKFFPKAG